MKLRLKLNFVKNNKHYFLFIACCISLQVFGQTTASLQKKVDSLVELNHLAFMKPLAEVYKQNIQNPAFLSSGEWAKTKQKFFVGNTDYTRSQSQIDSILLKLNEHITNGKQFKTKFFSELRQLPDTAKTLKKEFLSLAKPYILDESDLNLAKLYLEREKGTKEREQAVFIDESIILSFNNKIQRLLADNYLGHHGQLINTFLKECKIDLLRGVNEDWTTFFNKKQNAYEIFKLSDSLKWCGLSNEQRDAHILKITNDEINSLKFEIQAYLELKKLNVTNKHTFVRCENMIEAYRISGNSIYSLRSTYDLFQVKRVLGGMCGSYKF